MNLQEYVKYLLCILFIQLTIIYNGETLALKLGKSRTARGFWDLLLGRFRTCGVCICGKSNRDGAKFLGGESTRSHEFPWLVNIYIKSQLQLSGVLINDRYILTAASGLVGTTAPEVKVTLGLYDRCHIDISSANFSVDSVIPYPEYVSHTQAHNLALIRLSRPIKIEKRISPVCLPNPGSTYLGQVGTLVGWTESEIDDNNPGCLPRKLGLPILGPGECIKSGIKSTNFHHDSGCIGIIGGKSIVCQNDVGASVLYRSYSDTYDLIGILSEGNQCDADSTKAGIYTRVGSHLDWILQNTKDACYCTK